MDLKKFKMISAILLAVALLFLSVIMIINKNKADNLPYSAAEDLSALLASCGVTLSPDTVPLKRERLPVYSLPAVDGVEAQRIAETLGSSTRIAANLTEDGYRFRLENADTSTFPTVLTAQMPITRSHIPPPMSQKKRRMHLFPVFIRHPQMTMPCCAATCLRNTHPWEATLCLNSIFT